MVLNYVGETMSLEMELPKIHHLSLVLPPSIFSDCEFFDLPDWLTWRATGDKSRSACSLACKCSFVPVGVEGSEGWNRELFEKIGLGEMVSRIRLIWALSWGMGLGSGVLRR